MQRHQGWRTNEWIWASPCLEHGVQRREKCWVRPERDTRAGSQRSWGASLLKCFSWLVGSKEPFTVSLSEDEVALGSLAGPHFLPSHFRSWQFVLKVHVHTGSTFQGFTGLTGGPADAWGGCAGALNVLHPYSTGYSWRCVTTQRTEAPLWLKVVAR